MRRSFALCCLAVLAGCDDDAGLVVDAEGPPIRRPRDRGLVDVDAAPPRDARPAERDAGADAGPDLDAAPEPDMASPRGDQGPTPPDMAPPELDVGPEPDLGPPEPDMAPPEPDAGGPVSAECRAALDAARFTWEAGPQGWSHARMDDVNGDWPLDPWEQGQAVAGPEGCAEGRGCWGTDLDDNLVQCQRAELRSPVIDLTACAGHDLLLVYEQWHAFWTGNVGGVDYFDGGTVEAGVLNDFFAVLAPHRFPGTLRINPDLGFDYRCLRPDDFYVDGLPGFIGQSPGWETVRLPLEGLHAGGPIVLRFAFATGVSERTVDPAVSQRNQLPGWYLDDLRFEIR